MTAIRHGRQNKPLLAVGLCLVAMTLFSMQDALVKWLAADYMLLQLLFVRSVVVVLAMGLFIMIRQGIDGFKTKKPKDHMARTTFNFCAFLSYYMAVTQMPLANATSIGMTAPLFMTALAGPLLGEPVGLKRKLMMAVGFVGVLIVIQPTAVDLNLKGTLYALAGAVMFALLAIQSRKMGTSESSELMVFYSALVFLLITGVLMISHWQTPEPQYLLFMVMLGCVTLFAQYTLIHSYKYARVHLLAPFEYITVLWAVLLGWAFFFRGTYADVAGWGDPDCIVGSVYLLVRKTRV